MRGPTKLHTASEILSQSMHKYFETNKGNFEIMHDICTKQQPMSLRVLDWLCTNFSKSRSGALTSGCNVELHHKYENQLKGFGKRFFDPFRRKFPMKIAMHGTVFKTSIGQLNFFRWAFDNDIVKFALCNKQDIETDMCNRVQMAKAKSVTEQRPGRQQLSELASNHCTKRVRMIRVSFEKPDK